MPSQGRRSVLVTGGAGFIGSFLVESLVARGDSVTIIDDLSTGNLQNIASVLSSVEVLQEELGSLLERKPSLVSSFDMVVHLSANSYVPPSVDDPLFDFRQNLQNTILVLEALRCHNRNALLLNASSAAVYGDPEKIPIAESDITIPISPYGVSKLGADRYVHVYSQLYGIHAVNLRFFSVCGPRIRKQVIFDFIGKLRRDPSVLEIYGDGSQLRDLVYVKDLVRAILTIAERGALNGESYNIASGTVHTIAEIAAAVCEACGVDPEIRYTGSVRPGDPQRWVVDISRLASLGFKAAYDLRSATKEIVEWYDTTYVSRSYQNGITAAHAKAKVER